MSNEPVIVIGAGPAGLAAAHELTGQGFTPLVLEKADRVGGISRTEVYQGYRFDIGGHRFFTHFQEIQGLWQEMLGPDLLTTKRLSRIYYRGRFLNYPLEAWNTLANLRPWESTLILFSYLKALIVPHAVEENFEQWVSNRFGRRLYETFFKHYTEKIWGLSCQEIQADWAAQRISGLSLKTALMHALLGSNHIRTLITEFLYPVLGPGQMWERFKEKVEARGGRVVFNCPVVRLQHQGNRLTGVVVVEGGREKQLPVREVISSMPLSALVQRLNPPAPRLIQEAASYLTFRDFILVGLIVSQAQVFPDQWLYIHGPEVKVGRIQNFKNWSPAMVPDSETTSLGLEYFCNVGDDLWNLDDQELIRLAVQEVSRLGLVQAHKVQGGVVFRQSKAYPVYRLGYRQALDTIQTFLSTLENLQTIGRNGMYRYNNQDHSMLTGILAARNLRGVIRNLWDVNTLERHHEEASGAAKA